MTELPALELHVGDFDGEGTPDLATIEPSEGDFIVRFWRNEGMGEFSPGGQLTLDQGHVEGRVPQLASLDADGLTDVVAFEIAQTQGRVLSYINDGQWGVLPPVETDIMGAGEPWASVILADLDSDGLDDALAEPYGSSGTLHALENAGDGAFEVSPSTIESAEGCWMTNWTKLPAYSAFTGGVVFVPGDCSGVEHSELTVVVAQQGGDTLSSKVATSGSAPGATAAGDFDGDGEVEVLVWDRVAQNFELFRADFLGALDPLSTLTLTELCPVCSAPAEGAANVQLAAGQLDGDPADDLVLSFNSSMHIGSNPLTDAPIWVSTSERAGPILRQLVLDVDGDGADDILVSDDSNEFTHCLLNRY